jgi:hypothetical protein
MNLKIILAGLVGGVVMFLWGFIAHMVLPLGEAGFRTLSHQDVVLPAISAQIKEDGLYIFPWPESPPGTPMPVNDESRKKAEQLFQTSPHGLLLFHTPPAAMLTGGQLGTEFATNCVSSLLAAMLVSMALGCLGSFAKRVFFVATIGLIAGVAVNVPNWNWYGFPSSFTLAHIAVHVMGFAAAGVAIAAIVKPAVGSGLAPKTA